MECTAEVAFVWERNGDHPDDACETLTDEDGNTFLSEGKVVRYFRHPTLCGVNTCIHCQRSFDRHGWIDSVDGGQIVCPGDLIARAPEGHYVVIPQQLDRTLTHINRSLQFTSEEPA